MFTTTLVFAAALLIAANVDRCWWALALYAGALISVIAALALAHVELVPPDRAISAAPWMAHGVFCWLSCCFFRFGFGLLESLRE